MDTDNMQREGADKGELKRRRNDPDRLGRDRIGKLLFEFSVPAIVSMVFGSLYNVVDAAFLGHAVGEVGVAVTTLAYPIMTILWGFSMLAGQGGSALAAIQLGEGRRSFVEKTLGNTTVLLIVISAIVAVIAIFLIDPLLVLIGTDAELWEPTKQFVQIVCIGSLFQSIGGGLNNFLRSAGKPRLALYTGMLGTLMCIVFNYLFVMVLGWGIPGSAVATIVGQLCGGIPVVWYFLFIKSAPFRLRWSGCRPDFSLMRKILSLGLASFVMQVASTVVSIVFNQVVQHYGSLDPLGSTNAFAAMGMAMRAIGFAITPIIGVIMGAQPIIGYNFGAQKWQRVLDALKWACIAATILAIFFFALTHLIPRTIVSMFGITGSLESFAIWCLQVYTMAFPVIGFQIMGASYFQSSGQPLKATVLELTRQVIFLIPLYFLMPLLGPVFGTTGLMMIPVCMPLTDILSTLVTAVFVVIEVRKLRVRRDEAKALAASGQGSAAEEGAANAGGLAE